MTLPFKMSQMDFKKGIPDGSRVSANGTFISAFSCSWDISASSAPHHFDIVDITVQCQFCIGRGQLEMKTDHKLTDSAVSFEPQLE